MICRRGREIVWAGITLGIGAVGGMGRQWELLLDASLAYIGPLKGFLKFSLEYSTFWPYLIDICSTVASSPPSSEIGVPTLMLESKKCIFFYHLLKSTPLNLSSLAKSQIRVKTINSLANYQDGYRISLEVVAKVTAIEESKDLSSLALDELIAKKESSDDETLTSGSESSDDEEYAMVVRNFKKFFRKEDVNDAEDKTNDETCLMAQSSNEVTLNSSYYSDNASSFDNDNMQIEYDGFCEISLKIINKNKILKTKRDLLEKKLELNEKIKKLKRSKEIESACKSCDELKSENAKLKETQVKFVKFDKSDNTLREMLDNQNSSSCKTGLGFDNSKASTNGTKIMSFVRSSAENATDGSTIIGHGSTMPGSVSRNDDQKGTEHVFSPPLSSRSDFVITRKRLIHNSIDISKKLSLKPSLKSGIVYVKTESRSKTPPPRRNISSQPRYNSP
ncbi:hypothetical protein Tco_0516068 [Tanacetum coccineum]